MSRKWIEGMPVHIYVRGLKGWVIFYNREDFLFYTTLLYVTSRKMDIKIVSICLMINHIHLLLEVSKQETLSRFMNVVNSSFAKKYNLRYGRKGQLFESPYGWAQKTVEKQVRTCAAYINNNPVVGHLVDSAEKYQWNMLAYYECRFPFSMKIGKHQAGRKLRRAMDMTDVFFKRNMELTFPILDRLFDGLDRIGKKQLTDYILSLYNPIDYRELSRLFRDVPSAIKAFAYNTGEEHDIPDDWSDYSLYREAIRIIRKNTDKYVESIDESTLRQIAGLLYSCHGLTTKLISKVLHLKQGNLYNNDAGR